MITRVESLASGEFIITCLSGVIVPGDEQEVDGYWDGNRWNCIASHAFRFADSDKAEELAEELAGSNGLNE